MDRSVEVNKATSLDVAKRAGVSQSAVSRVFTPGASASKSTRKKVLAAAADLGYRPNILARSLITGRSRLIGIVVGYLNNQFYPEALERLSNMFQERGYHLLIFTVDNDSAQVERTVSDLLDYQVEGMIAASVGMSSTLTARCHAAGIPVVLFNRGQDDDRLSTVASDNYRGGHRIATFLQACGHKRIAHISGWQGSSTGRDRRQGFVDGLNQSQMEPVAIIDGHYDRDLSIKAAEEIMDTASPDAIFVGNDHMAFAVLDYLRHIRKLRVPEDVAVIGYDDVPMASWPSYFLTSLRQPINQMVAAAVDLIIGQIENPMRNAQKRLLMGPIMQRGTTLVPHDTWSDNEKL